MQTPAKSLSGDPLSPSYSFPPPFIIILLVPRPSPTLFSLPIIFSIAFYLDDIHGLPVLCKSVTRGFLGETLITVRFRLYLSVPRTLVHSLGCTFPSPWKHLETTPLLFPSSL